MTEARHSILALLLLASVRALAQQPSPAAQSGYTISGIVVSATTGKPLDRATVTVSTDLGAQVAKTDTPQDGDFAFEHLRAGHYVLRAARRGYNPSAYDEHDNYYTDIVTGPNLDATSLRFKLQPQAVIFGTVTDDAGDPVRDAQVMLYKKDSYGGTGKIAPAGGQQTNDIGAFEVARLAPGDYFVSISATPWYATRSQPTLDAHGNPSPDPPASSPLDVAYPLTFYADATDSDSATPIPVRAGDRIQVNFSLRAEPAVYLRMPIPPDSQTRGFVWPQITQNVFGQHFPVSASASSSPTTVEIGGIPPGHYDVIFPGKNSARDLDLTSSTSIENAPADPGVDILGKVVLMNGQPVLGRINVYLSSTATDFNRGLTTEKDGTFKMEAVPSGTYDVEVNGLGSAFFIAHMAADGASIEGHQVKVGSSPVNLALIVTSDSATVSGFAKHNGQAASGAMIVLVPRNPDADRELFRRDQSNSDGSFQLRNIAPGTYMLVAIDDGWSLDWARPQVLARYLPHGLKINVAISQRNITLSETVAVQQR